ncbi:hypothetical protein LINGRAHAP2_LOCUS18903, partial [Linum grandiflorum]
MNNQRDGPPQRTLADMPPELLNLIYSKLGNSSDKADGFKVGEKLDRRVREQSILYRIPADVRKLVHNSEIIYKFKQKGWLLLQYRYEYPKDLSGSLSCFNPLLSWPSCYIPLPGLNIHDLPDFEIAAAFSADPTRDPGDGDLRIIVFHGGHLFMVIRIRKAGPGEKYLLLEQPKYYIIRSRSCRVPVAADHTGGKFFVLFESGDILVWDTQKGGLRRMLKANPPINFRIRKVNRIRAVGESLVMIWKRRLSSSVIRLASVEEIQIVDNHYGGDNGDQVEELEEGVGTITYFVREDVNVKIKKKLPTFVFFSIFSLFLMIFISLIVFLIITLCKDNYNS